MSSPATASPPDSRLESTRRRAVNRRLGLLLPMLLFVIFALLAFSVLLYWSAEALNQRQAEAQESLITSILDNRRSALRSLVVDYAWWDEVIVTFDVGMDERWANEELGAYLQEAFGISCLWILGPDNETKAAFIQGAPSTVDIFDVFQDGAGRLLQEARDGRTIEDVPQPGFVLNNGKLELISASIVSPFASIAGPPDPEDAALVVFGQPLEEAFFNSPALNSFLEMPRFMIGSPPEGYLGHEITGADGTVLGHIVWQDTRPGDELLWRVAPLLFAALLILLLLVGLMVRRVEAVVSREGRLALSLDHERQRRQDKSQFVSMVSHELRTPLQAIGSAADTLERYGDQMTLEECREETRTIRQGVSVLAGLVDDVLLVGRADTTRQVASEECIDLAELCSAVWREVSLALKADHRLRLSDRIGHPVCGGAQTMLHAVLSNLFQNAVKYSEAGGEVEVEIAEEHGNYRIAVRDFGPGIAPQLRAAVFEPYWRADSVAKVPGAGLGLPIARASARSLGGDLTVECDDLDVGTRFVLRWPRLRDD